MCATDHRVIPGAYIERHKQSLNDFLDKWARDWANNNLSAKTAERYLELPRLHVRPHLGGKAIQSIGVQDFNALYASLHDKLCPRTVKHVHRLYIACLVTRRSGA